MGEDHIEGLITEIDVQDEPNVKRHAVAICNQLLGDLRRIADALERLADVAEEAEA